MGNAQLRSFSEFQRFSFQNFSFYPTGFVLRDLELHNIPIHHDRAKVADFGLAKDFQWIQPS